MNINNDRRAIIVDNFILVTNLKVGYSSINALHLSQDNDQNKEITKEINNKKVIFIYRNIIERIISGFLFWTLGMNSKRIPEYKPFEREIPETLLIYIDLIKTFKNIKEFNDNKCAIMIKIFKIFLNNFDLFGWNGHYTNQINIIKYYNLEPDYLVNLKNSIDDIKKISGINFPRVNVNTDNNIKSYKNILLLFLKNEPTFIEKLKSYYDNDINFFKKYNIDIFDI
jgi:hypothetical protein